MSDPGDTPPRRLSCLARLTLLLLGAVAGAVPEWLLLPDATITAVLGYLYDSARYDLTDPDLLRTWRGILSAAAGLLLSLLFALLFPLLRRARRPADRTPAELRALRAAVRRGDDEALVASLERVGEKLGDEAVPDLVAVSEGDWPRAVRHAAAAALFRIGRAVTAEVELHPSPRAARR